MRVNSLKGTNDYLPEVQQLRDYLQSVILRTYQNNGYERIATPIIEDIENLDNSDGGENLKLIFKVMKRGDKLTKALEAGRFDDLADIGLRYDLTLPLCRFYAANRDKLAKPFKVIQMGDVFRAEQPQKGRLRQFVQCDIDVIGSDAPSIEIECINVMGKALMNIGIKNFKMKINDRRVLNAMLISAGFPKEDLMSVCISFDKLDKIGVDGVIGELREKGFPEATLTKFRSLIEGGEITLEKAREFCEDKGPAENLQYIIDTSNELAEGKYETVFDMSLVRGQGYYTGTIFEVESLDFGSSIAGGGRYDNLVGKFLGEDIPACGFSIGFERICAILMDNGFEIPGKPKRFAVIHEENQTAEAIRYADSKRGEYDVTLISKPNKLGKLFGKLESQGFAGCYVIGDEADKWF